MLGHICNSSIESVHKLVTLGLAVQLVCPKQGLLGSVSISVSKTKVEKGRGRHLAVTFHLY